MGTHRRKFTNLLDSGQRVEMQKDDLGSIRGAKIQALTDAAGSQVAVTGKRHPSSQPPTKRSCCCGRIGASDYRSRYARHLSRVVRSQKWWYGFGLFAVFGGPFRSSDPPKETLDEVAE